MPALGWLFKISLVDLLVQRIQSSSQWGQMIRRGCVILHIYLDVGCYPLAMLSFVHKVLHECLNGFLGL